MKEREIEGMERGREVRQGNRKKGKGVESQGEGTARKKGNGGMKGKESKDSIKRQGR